MNCIDTPNLCIPHEAFEYVTNAIIKAYVALNEGPEIESVSRTPAHASVYQAALLPSPCAAWSSLSNSHILWCLL